MSVRGRLQPVHRLHRDDQRVRGVEAAGHADHDLGVADRPEPLLEPGDLDVVGLVAVEGEPLGVVGHERVAVDVAAQADVAGRRVERHLDGAELRHPAVVRAAVVVEGALPLPLLADLQQVDVGHGAARPVGEPLGLREQLPQLVDHGLPVPRQVGAGLAEPGRGVHVGRQAARRGRAHQQPAVLGAADGDRAAGDVDQHGGTGERGLGTRRHRHPHVLADLDVQDQARHVGRPEEQVGPERHLHPTEDDRRAAAVVAGREVAALVELPVGRQVGLRRHPEHAAAVHHDGAVEDAGAVPQRCPDDEHHAEVDGAGDEVGDRLLDRVEHGLLQQQVVDGVAGQGELGEHRDRDAVVGARACLGQHRRGVGPRVRDRRGDRARRDPREALVVRRGEVHGSSLPAHPPFPLQRGVVGSARTSWQAPGRT